MPTIATQIITPKPIQRDYLDASVTAIATPVTIPADTADSVWIISLTISAPSPDVPISVRAQVCPMNSSTGEIFHDKPSQELSVWIDIPSVNDAIAGGNPAWGPGLAAIYTAIQEYVNANNTFGS